MSYLFVVLVSMATASIAIAQAPTTATPALPETRPEIAVPGNSVAPSNSAHQDPVTTPTSATGPIQDVSPKSAGNIATDTQTEPRSQNALTPRVATRTANPLASSFVKLDTNHDGVLSIEEMNAVAGNTASLRFQQMDTNHDGKISAAEYSAAQARAGRQPEAGPPGSTTSDPTGEAHASRTPNSNTPGPSQQ